MTIVHRPSPVEELQTLHPATDHPHEDHATSKRTAGVPAETPRA